MKHGCESRLKSNPNTKQETCCCRACCYSLPMFHPHGIIRLFWDILIILVLIYSAIEIPLTIAFQLQYILTNALGVIALCVDIVLLIDIAFNFRTPYYDKWDRLKLHIDPMDVAMHYFKGWFWLDFITSFPFEIIIHNKFVIYIKILRIFRLIRAFNTLKHLRGYLTSKACFIWKLLPILSVMILTAHWFSCIWWYAGIQAYNGQPIYVNDNGITIYSSWIQASGIELDDSLFVKYTYCWYLTIIGYDNITLHNPTEQWIASIFVLTKVVFFGYIVATLTKQYGALKMQKVEDANLFCKHYKFDGELTRSILNHIQYYCDYNLIFNSEDILSVLPPFLQREVNTKMAEKYLPQLDLFKDLPSEIIGKIALSMHAISCNTGRYLYKRGDIATCMYLQRSGESKLRYLDGTQSRRLRRGDVVGERSLIAGKRRYDVLCTIWTEFFVLNIVDIKNILMSNFKPKRFKFEWNKMRKLVKMSDSRGNLINVTPNIHELPSREVPLQSKLLQKNNGPGIYRKCATDDNDKNEDKSTSALDVNNTSTPQLHMTRPIPVYQSEFSELEEQETEKINYGKKSISPTNNNPALKTSTLFSKLSPFYVRHNSVERNEKVHTVSNITSNYSETETLLLDLDQSTEGTDQDQDVLSIKTTNMKQKFGSNRRLTKTVKVDIEEKKEEREEILPKMIKMEILNMSDIENDNQRKSNKLDIRSIVKIDSYETTESHEANSNSNEDEEEEMISKMMVKTEKQYEFKNDKTTIKTSVELNEIRSNSNDNEFETNIMVYNDDKHTKNMNNQKNESNIT